MLDKETLKSLFTLESETGPGLVKQLCDLFALNFPAAMREVAHALDREDDEVIASKAHYMKSTCRHFGAREIADLLEKLEQSAPDRNFEELKILWAQLEKIYPSTSLEIAALPERAAKS